MKRKKKHIGKKLHISEKDFILANRRAARLEDIELHGRPTAFRKVLHRSKKAYNRKKYKSEIPSD